LHPGKTDEKKVTIRQQSYITVRLDGDRDVKKKKGYMEVK